jgi:hypothetical protein
MLSRRQIFTWMAGAAAAAASIPALSKAQIIALKRPPANPYYLTNYDAPEWFDAQPVDRMLNTGPGVVVAEGDLRRDAPVQVVGELEPVSQRPLETYDVKIRLSDGTVTTVQGTRLGHRPLASQIDPTAPNPALDAAIDQAMKGLSHA